MALVADRPRSGPATRTVTIGLLLRVSTPGSDPATKRKR